MGRAPLPLSKDRQTMLFLNSLPAGPVACIRGRENCWCGMDASPIQRLTEYEYRLNSEFPEKWTIPHAYSTLSLGSRSRNFHGICSPRTRSPTTGTYHRIVNHTFTAKCNDDTIVHSLCFRCATRMRTRTDCQGSVRMMQNKVLRCVLFLKISMSRAWKGEIGI
jgi:hypothetical protein